MKCAQCQRNTVSRRVKKHHWHSGRLFVVENVPVEVCRDCGERYYHATTLDAIDQLLNGDHQVKKKLNVEVIALEAV